MSSASSVYSKQPVVDTQARSRSNASVELRVIDSHPMPPLLSSMDVDQEEAPDRGDPRTSLGSPTICPVKGCKTKLRVSGIPTYDGRMPDEPDTCPEHGLRIFKGADGAKWAECTRCNGWKAMIDRSRPGADLNWGKKFCTHWRNEHGEKMTLISASTAPEACVDRPCIAASNAPCQICIVHHRVSTHRFSP